MKRLFSLLFICTFLASGFALTGCDDHEGPAEKAGKKVDEAIQDTKRAIDDATD
ncbi:hypothetical protein SAMN06265365_10567 [Tistlia consotensis]|uniref:Entericidin EcnA/B family protein n=1 Tax=Tistlia consotensis USBA 355 TaxID=560819 RepID=A0A1Y6BJ66_9PROT|nr:hypothetical protein [Tistlia consotensis]SMF14103.1 hypothetical protein SAMN05428998_105231 [Tistlia consotensis USBA 355]SNR49869.1 hypothetical protein SAMN06265365_10567 [Tistlia consotensis]